MNLTVQPLTGGHVQQGYVGLAQSTANDLGIGDGSYVTVDAGTSSLTLGVRTNEKRWQRDSTIFLDGRTRNKLGVSLEQTVSVSTADVVPAQSVTVAFQQSMKVKGDVSEFLRDTLSGRALDESQNITVPFELFESGFGNVSAYVVSTEPGSPVVVTDTTSFEVADQTYEEYVGETDIETVTYDQIGGLHEEVQRVREMVEVPMRNPELFEHLGIDAPSGVILHGPPGTGKTLMAKAVANEVDAYFTSISGPEIMSKYYGESEQQLRDVFEEATDNSPSVVFIDELDSIAPDRDEAGGETEQRIVAQLLSLMDGLGARDNVVVIAATNRLDAVDNALRRGGRFDREIEVGVPDRNERREILDVHTRNVPLDGVDLDEYAENTHGYVGADIDSMVKEAAMNALRRVRPDLDLTDDIPIDVIESIDVTDEDLRTAHRATTPSALREVFVEVPDVSWEDVGGLDDTKQRIQEAVQWPMEHEQVFDDMDITPATGTLLYGPPGTGKTLMAKAVANESDANFISVKGPELLSKWVGESEKGVREIFETARENAPSVVFFDELDAIAQPRGEDQGSGVGERVVSQLLTELDGLEALDDVTVIATSNRPERIDGAILRPGRLDSLVHVPAPDAAARRQIFDVHMPESDVDPSWLADETDGYVGADIEAVCREAKMIAARQLIESGDGTETAVTREHFEQALDEIGPSIDEDVLDAYDQIEQELESRADETPDEEAGLGRNGFR